MISLFLDTCTSNLIISLFENDINIYNKQEITKNDLSIKLLPYIKECFDNSNKKIDDVDIIYVCNGPGSFTGVRMGVTVAKVAAYSLNKKIIPLSELDVIASTDSNKKYIVPIIDARRGYVYSSIYDNELNILFENKYILLEKLIEYIGDNYDINDVEFVSYDNFNIDEIEIKKPSPNILKVINKHKNDREISCHQINPNYLKLTEAEEKLNDSRNF